MPKSRKLESKKKGRHDHLHVRPSGVIYTTAEELLSDPEVRKEIRGTVEVLKDVVKRRLRKEK